MENSKSLNDSSKTRWDFTYFQNITLCFKVPVAFSSNDSKYSMLKYKYELPLTHNGESFIFRFNLARKFFLKRNYLLDKHFRCFILVGFFLLKMLNVEIEKVLCDLINSLI